jgi:DNA-binding response OmpR family regulator
MKIVIIDDQKGEADIMMVFAQDHGFDAKEHRTCVVWQIDSVQHAVEQALETTPDAIFVDWQFDDTYYPIPTGITGAKIVTALRFSGYTGKIYSHSSSGLKNFEEAGVAGIMNQESTNKKSEIFAEIVVAISNS